MPTIKISAAPVAGKASVSWQEREGQRFAKGKYVAPPWKDAPWAQLAEGDPRAMHFVHVSERDPWMLAYTPSERDGAADRRVPIKPGRYLQKFYADKLTPEEIKHWAGQVRGSGLRLCYTDDPVKAQTIYQVSGITACMSYGAGHYRAAGYNGGLHPIAAYFGGDIQLAYALDPEGRAVARALVWPERKLFSRAYGDSEAMKKALEAEGFTYGLFDGARLLHLPLKDHADLFTAPYIDHVKWARLEMVDGKPCVRLQIKATGATHSVQHGDGIGYPIEKAPSRPANQTGESIAAEHKRLVALEAGAPAPEVKVKDEMSLAGLFARAVAEEQARHEYERAQANLGGILNQAAGLQQLANTQQANVLPAWWDNNITVRDLVMPIMPIVPEGPQE